MGPLRVARLFQWEDRYTNRMEAFTSRFVTDARRGLVVTGKRLSEAGRHPWGDESASWRQWLYPFYVAVLAFMPLVGAIQGYWDWVAALPSSLVLGLVSMSMLGRLARRDDRQ
jgi:hypothetical protein